MKEEINEIIEKAIDEYWIPFEFKFIEWEENFKKKYL